MIEGEITCGGSPNAEHNSSQVGDIIVFIFIYKRFVWLPHLVKMEYMMVLQHWMYHCLTYIDIIISFKSFMTAQMYWVLGRPRSASLSKTSYQLEYILIQVGIIDSVDTLYLRVVL